MFLELSFNSRAGDKEVAASKAASSWRYDREDKQEMSLDELISDFQQSTTSRRSKLLNASASGSDASPLRMASPPRHAKSKENDKKSWGFTDRTRVAKREPSKKKPVRVTTSNLQDDDSSDDDGGAVTPMPRLEQILKNKPSFALKRRTPAASTVSTRSKQAPVQRSKPRARSPVLSSLSPQPLSPLTSSSLASSPLSVSEDIYAPETPDEDSIDALIGKDIRELNKLVTTGSRQTRGRKAIGAARSPTTDEISSVLRQSTRFRNTETKKSRLPLQIKMHRGTARSESPPPPPPPEDEDVDFEDDEEDSFADEIRKLRESHRLSALPFKPPEKETPKEETELESSAVCATAALKVRNASIAINELLLAALKPFEDRQREEEKTNALEEENAHGDAVIRNAATAELQSATQTIVSQLDLTFADMTERRKADLKAEEDAAAASKAAEKKEKEAAEAKRKADEKETKEREMEILRLIPMQGKLLTCSADIENLLTQLERTDTEAQRQPMDSESAMEAEITALRRHTQRKIHEIEAAAPSKKGESDRIDGISWRAVNWVQDNSNLAVDQSTPHDRGNDQLPAKTEIVETNVETTDDEGAYQDILQRQVLEKLDLTMLKLKHVLSIDTKEAAEVQEKQQREKEEQLKKKAQKQLEDERKEREQEDADNARRRVMGLTSIDEVEGWIEEGRQLQDELGHDRSLNRLIASLDDSMNVENARTPCWRTIPPNQEEALRHFDRLSTAMTAQQQPPLIDEEAMHEHGDYNPDDGCAYWHAGSPQTLRAQHAQTSKKQSWKELSESSSGSEDEGVSTRRVSGTDEMLSRVRITERRRNQDSTRRRNRIHRSPPPSPLPSPPRQTRHVSSSSGKQRRKHAEDEGDRILSYKRQHGVSPSSELKQRRHRRGVSGLQQEIDRTIYALQAERRQKTWWIQSHLRSPSGRRRPSN